MSVGVRSGKGDSKGRERRLEVDSRQRRLIGESEGASTEVWEGISRKGVDNEEHEE